MSLEVEIKLRAGGAREARELLERAGLEAVHERALEVNTVYDTPENRLLAGKQLLRLRRFRGRAILTYKGAPLGGTHKRRPEFETEAADGAALENIFAALGYLPKFRYEKYRTTYGDPDSAGHVCLDETPMGVFLELEGEPEWIDRMARRLGYGQQDYVTASYGTLWREFCLKHGLGEADMRFEDQN